MGCRTCALPASSVDRVECAAGDYETELAYHEMVGPADPDYPGGRRWLAPGHPDVDAPDADEDGADRAKPICLHFAVNRPVGCVRESDLASILPWLRRYSRWLEDKLRLSAACMRSCGWSRCRARCCRGGGRS